MTLELSEIPGGSWKMESEQSWRSGYIVSDRKSERARRSRKTGGFVTRRSFRQSTTQRGFWVQLIPFGLESDAQTAVPLTFSTASANPNFKGVLNQTEQVSVHVGGVQHVVAEERSSTLNPEGPSNTKYVAGSVSHVVFAFACYEHGAGWAWDEVASLAEIQANKIAEALSGGTNEFDS
jgi:hypothetical protein